MAVAMTLRVLQVSEVDDVAQTMTVEMTVGLSWLEPRLLFNNIFNWEVRQSVKVCRYFCVLYTSMHPVQTNEKIVEHLWAPNLHFLSTEKIEKISTLKNSGTVTIYRNGTVHYSSHIRLTVGE